MAIKRAFQSGFALLILSCALVTPTSGSQFEPHLPSFNHDWFDGWYIRIVTDLEVSDKRAPRSLGLIAGYLPRGRKGWTDSTVQLLLQPLKDPNGKLMVVKDEDQNFNVTVRGGAVENEPKFLTPPDFEVNSDAFHLAFHGDDCVFAAAVKGVEIQANCRGKGDVPYGPHNESPEGVFADAPLGVVGQHWFVHSLGTPVAFLYSSNDTGAVAQGRGFAHLETNWGFRFPEGWAWAQGLSSSNGSLESAFVLAGGTPPSPFAPQWGPEAWLLGVRVRELNWRFHPWDPAVFKVESQPCGEVTRSFRLHYKQLLTGNEAEIFLTAPADSFAKVQCPRPHAGFQTFSSQSYAGNARLRLWTTDGPHGKVLIHDETISDAALEFGGNKRCLQSAMSMQ